jgi:hypothetical protein
VAVAHWLKRWDEHIDQRDDEEANGYALQYTAESEGIQGVTEGVVVPEPIPAI